MEHSNTVLPIEVVAAVRQDGDHYWICRRKGNGSHGGLAGMWEYPGGKVEDGETHRQALHREMLEEFGVKIEIHGQIGHSIVTTIPDSNTQYKVTFFLVIFLGKPKLSCHDLTKWCTVVELQLDKHLPSGIEFNKRLADAVSPRDRCERVDTGRQCVLERGHHGHCSPRASDAASQKDIECYMCNTGARGTWMCARHQRESASSSSDTTLPDGWVSCPSIQYAGREYAIVWQHDKPFLCCRINDQWMVEHAIGHSEDATPATDDDEHRKFWLRWCRDFFIIKSGMAGPHVPWLNELLHPHPENAAPVAWRVTDEMIRAALATELEDGLISQDVGFGMMRLILENAALYAHPEDAPKGPWETSQQEDDLWIVRPKLLGGRYVKWRFEGTERECNGVRDTLNRLQGDKK